MARVQHTYEMMNSSALQAPHIFVVDMIHGFCKEGAMADISIMEIVPSIKCVLEIENQKELPIFFIDGHAEDAIEFKSFPIHCILGTKEANIIEELMMYDKKVVYKNSTNGFHEITFYKDKIKANPDSIKEIIITGCCTDICVMQFALTLKTWLNANNLDIQVIIPVDCVDTYDSGNSYHVAETFNEVALTVMEQAGIKIIGGFVYEV